MRGLLFSFEEDKTMKTERDLTVGPVGTQLAKFALPLLLANLLQSFYNIADMLVVGRIVGSAGVAAISNASTLVFIINAICTGLAMGGTVLIAQYKGANDIAPQRETAGTIYSLAAIVAAVITVLGIFTCEPLIGLLNVPAEALEYTRDYMFIIFTGTFFVFGYNTTCSVLRGLGDSTRPLIFVGIATFINVVLDCVFVGPLGMGTAGAALATVIAQGASFAISVSYLKRSSFVFAFKLRSFAIKKDKLAAVLKISLPTVIQLTVVNVSYFVTAAMLNVYGVTVAAAAGIGLKINTFAAMPCWAIGQAMMAMVGQNMGAGLADRAQKTGRMGLWMSLAATFIAVTAVQIFSVQIMGLFAPTEPNVGNEGVCYLGICCFWNTLFYAAMYSFNSFAIGVGAAGFAMTNALLDAAFIKLPLCFLLSIAVAGGFEGVYWGQALSSVIPALMGAAYFCKGGWREKKLI